MKKIIFVGHPQSDLDEVKKILSTCGIAEARPSRREGLTPVQISEALVKAHGTVPVQHVSSPSELQQITVAPVWQGLALDLMLANIEVPLWGWADTQAVYLLEFWKNQDPQTIFVLVFDAPSSALTRHAIEQLKSEPEMLQAKVNGWIAYNAALLNFHLRNTDRSLLVHAEQVQTSALHYVQQLSAHIDATLKLPSVSDSQLSVAADSAVLHTEDSVTLCDKAGSGSQQTLRGNHLAEWLVQQLLEEQPEAADLYAQLQTAASIPLQVKGQPLASAHGLSHQRHQAWSTFVSQQVTLQQSIARLAHLDKTLQDKDLKLQANHGQIENLQDNIKQKAQEQELLLNGINAELQSREKENELLLIQLHQVQMDLENSYLQSKDQTKKLDELNKLLASFEKNNKSINDIPVDLKEENDLLLIQLQQMQEELEQFYTGKNNYENRSIFQSWEYRGAADRVKQQLSYRLGATMIAQSRSLGGWLCMPFTLRAEVQRFKQDQAKRGEKKLPPITQYSDAYEAEKIKQHLSYRLGARMIANSKSLGGWVAMPWALLKEVKTFQKKRQSSSRDVK